MQCPRCGCGVPDTKTECTYCGAPLPPPGSQQQHTPGGFGAHAGFGTGVAGDQEDHLHAEAPASAGPEFQIDEHEPAAGIPGLPLQQEHEPAAGIPGLPLQPQTQAPPPNYLQPPAAQPSYPQPNYLQGNEPGYAPPNYLAGNQPPGSVAAGGGEMRVSLTGEVMEAPPPPRVSGPVGAPPVPPPPRGPAPIPPRAGTRGSYMRPAREEAPARSGSGLLWGIVLAVIVLIGAGAGGWYWYNHRTNPKDQALKVYNALLVNHDWKAAYPLIAFNDENKKKYPNADAFASDINNQMSSNPMVGQLLNNLKFSNVATGEATVNGSSADVPTSSTLNVMGRSLNFHGTAHMVKEGGIWKLDATASSATEAAKLGQDLVGKPDMTGAGGTGALGGR